MKNKCKACLGTGRDIGDKQECFDCPMFKYQDFTTCHDCVSLACDVCGGSGEEEEEK